MSRIHEALRKAEQERAMSQSSAGIETAPAAVFEPSTNAAGGLVVRQQFIRTGRARGDFVAVETGLKPGEKVVSSGLFKLRNGMAVTENNEPVPKAADTPRPPDA